MIFYILSFLFFICFPSLCVFFIYLFIYFFHSLLYPYEFLSFLLISSILECFASLLSYFRSLLSLLSFFPLSLRFLHVLFVIVLSLVVCFLFISFNFPYFKPFQPSLVPIFLSWFRASFIQYFRFFPSLLSFMFPHSLSFHVLLSFLSYTPKHYFLLCISSRCFSLLSPIFSSRFTFYAFLL